MMRRSLSIALPALIVLASCDKLKATKAGADAAATAASAAPADSSAPVAKKEAVKPSTERRPMSVDEKRASKTYAAALGEGRAATRAKKYDDAVAAFDKALVAKPGDARALSERGYARLLAKDWAKATKDLERALEGTTDPDLMGPIYFNMGLVAEGKGDADAARVAFARSNAVKPTKAAQSKLDGKSKCVAVVDRKKVKATVAANVSAAYDAMKAAYEKRGYVNDDPKPANDAAIKKALCESGCSGDGPWLAKFPESGIVTVGFVVVPTEDKKLAVHELDEAAFGICGGVREATLKTGSFLHVRVETSSLMREWVKNDGKPCEPGAEDCLSGCFYAEWTHAHYFIDTKKGELVASVSESGSFEKSDKPKETVTVQESGGTVDISGGGCSEKLSLP